MKRGFVVLSVLFLLTLSIVVAAPLFDGGVWEQWLTGKNVFTGLQIAAPSCTDSDNGRNYEKFGTVTARTRTMWGKSRTTLISDRCSSSIQLQEQYCDGTSARSESYTCPQGCSNGACVASQSAAQVTTTSTSRRCTETDSGLDYYTQGTTRNVLKSTATDRCTNQNYLVEYYCRGRAGDVSSTSYLCPNGCQEGKCILSAGTQAPTQTSCTRDLDCNILPAESLSPNQKIRYTCNLNTQRCNVAYCQIYALECSDQFGGTTSDWNCVKNQCVPVKCAIHQDCQALTYLKGGLPAKEVYQCDQSSKKCMRAWCSNSAQVPTSGIANCVRKFGSDTSWQCVDRDGKTHRAGTGSAGVCIPGRQPSAIQCEYSEQVPLGTALNATSNFGPVVREDRVPSLKRGLVEISTPTAKNVYNWHEELLFGRVDAFPGTGLVLARADYNRSAGKWEDNVFLHLPSASVAYAYRFDNPLTIGNRITDSSPSTPLFLTFLGKMLIIQQATPTSLTLMNGEVFLNLSKGDSVVFNGKRVTIEEVGAEVVVVNVEGTIMTISKENQRTFTNANLLVHVADIIHNTNPQVKSVTNLIIGDLTTLKTYNDGDAFIGQDENSPTWVWNLENLDTATPRLEVAQNPPLTSYNSGAEYPDYGLSHPPFVGDKICLPSNYECISIVNLTQQDNAFGKYKVYATTKDLYESRTASQPVRSAAPLIAFEAVGQPPNTGLLSENIDTSGVYLYHDEESELFLARKDPLTQKIVLTGTSYRGPSTTLLSWFTLNYESTSIPVDIYDYRSISSLGAQDPWWYVSGAFRINPSGDNNALYVYFETAAPSGRFLYLGHSQGDTIRQNDLTFQGSGDAPREAFILTDISGFNAKTRTPDGIIIENYYQTGTRDEMKFSVPPDITNYKANVCIGKPQECTPGTQRLICKNTADGDPNFPGTVQICCNNYYRQPGLGGNCIGKPDGIWIDFQPVASC